MRKIGKVLICLTIIIFFSSCDDKPLSREDFMMDTVINIKIYGKNREEAMALIFQRLKDIDRNFNAHNEKSILNIINDTAGKEAGKYNKEVSSLIYKSLEYAKETDGAFNPALGNLITLWDVEPGERNSIPSEDEIKASLKKIDYNKVRVKTGEVFIEEEGISLDLGAIVKGYATEEIRKILSERDISAAIIDLGGNIAVYGEKPDGKPWLIGVRDPFNSEKIAYTFKTEGYTSSVTSGNYERFFTYKGKKYHHIMDPEKGYPVESDYSAVTVVNEDSEIGDMLSTALFVSGTEKAVDLLKKYNSDAAFIMNDGRILTTKGLYEKIDTVSEHYKIEILGD